MPSRWRLDMLDMLDMLDLEQPEAVESCWIMWQLRCFSPRQGWWWHLPRLNWATGFSFSWPAVSHQRHPITELQIICYSLSDTVNSSIIALVFFYTGCLWWTCSCSFFCGGRGLEPVAQLYIYILFIWYDICIYIYICIVYVYIYICMLYIYRCIYIYM